MIASPECSMRSILSTATHYSFSLKHSTFDDIAFQTQPLHFAVQSGKSINGTMASLTFRSVNCKQSVAPATRRNRVVKVSAVLKDSPKPSAAFAATAAAVLLACSPAVAVPAAYTPSTLNPAAEVAAGPGSKVKQAAEKLSGQGALAPDVEGQTRAGSAGRPGAAAQQKRTWVAASKEDQQSAIDKYPESQVNWRR